METKEIQQHYKWFLEHCKKRKREPISYEQYKKELLETIEKNNTPEEKERLKNLSKGLKGAMNLLK